MLSFRVLKFIFDYLTLEDKLKQDFKRLILLFINLYKTFFLFLATMLNFFKLIFMFLSSSINKF